jgi:hypothetical protein
LGVGGWAIYIAVASGSPDAAVLAACLLVSYAFRCLLLVKVVKEKALELMQQPSSLRAASLALTMPFHIYLVGHVVRLECIIGLSMLCIAQFVSSALTLVLEVTIVSAEVEECQPASASAPELMVGTNIAGPAADKEILSTHRQRAGWAWFACLACSGALHVAIWTVLLFYFTDMKAADSTTNVQLLVVGQFVALTLIWLVPCLHAGLRWTGAWSWQEELVSLSIVHAVLDITAKVLLSAAFLMP